jgi:hypothetical protein
MKSRIYVVQSPSGVSLVDSPSRSQAVSFVANSTIQAHVASQQDLVNYLGQGIGVQKYKPENLELDLGDEQ